MVLVARLAGPLQSWGAEPKLKTATTRPTPTWSGVRGLLRAALGHSRDADAADVAWLDELTVAIRVDSPGTVLVDYHTINPLPESYEEFGILGADRGIVPLGTKESSGKVKRWVIGQRLRPAVTIRHYLQDAAFLLLIEGPNERLDQLCDALVEPHWTLQLGRKSCTPATPLLLGKHPGDIVSVAQSAPTMTSKPVDTLDLVWLHGTRDESLTLTSTRTVLDKPLGPHPQHGYEPNDHRVTRLAMASSERADNNVTQGSDIDASDTGSSAATEFPFGNDALFEWALRYLTHPARPQEGSV